MPKPPEDRIRTRAHQLWEVAGKPDGREDRSWREAGRELSGDSAINTEESREIFTD